MSTDADAGAAPPGGRMTFGTPAVRADTLADRREFLAAGLRPVGCRSCATTVLVKKNSPKHTSIQWTAAPVTTCPVFAEQAAAGANTALLDTCPNLVDSIAAVADGLLAGDDTAGDDVGAAEAGGAGG